MTTNNWRDEFETVWIETMSNFNPLPDLLDFIETQIAQARREEREK